VEQCVWGGSVEGREGGEGEGRGREGRGRRGGEGKGGKMLHYKWETSKKSKENTVRGSLLPFWKSHSSMGVMLYLSHSVRIPINHIDGSHVI